MRVREVQRHQGAARRKVATSPWSPRAATPARSHHHNANERCINHEPRGDQAGRTATHKRPENNRPNRPITCPTQKSHLGEGRRSTTEREDQNNPAEDGIMVAREQGCFGCNEERRGRKAGRTEKAAAHGSRKVAQKSARFPQKLFRTYPVWSGSNERFHKGTDE